MSFALPATRVRFPRWALLRRRRPVATGGGTLRAGVEQPPQPMLHSICLGGAAYLR